MENNALNEKLFDALLGAAVCETFQKEIDSIDWAARTDHSFSPEHQKRIKTVFRRYHSRQNRLSALRWAKKIAVVILILISLTFAGMMSVKAIRDQVTHIVTKWYSKYIDIDFTREEQAGTTTEPKEVNLEVEGMALPSYIPEGYVEENMVRSFSIILVKYSNSDDFLIIYHQQSLSSAGALSIDSEGYTSEVVRINGYEGNIFIPSYDNKPINLIWNDDNFSYYLSGYFDREELIMIAESVTFVE